MNSTRKIVLLMLLGTSAVLSAQSTDPPKPTANAVEKKSNEKTAEKEGSLSKSQKRHKTNHEYNDAAPSAAASPTAAAPRPSTAQSSGDGGEGNATPIVLGGDPPPAPKPDGK